MGAAPSPFGSVPALGGTPATLFGGTPATPFGGAAASNPFGAPAAGGSLWAASAAATSSANRTKSKSNGRAPAFFPAAPPVVEALRQAFRTLLKSPPRPSPPSLSYVPRVPNCSATPLDPLEAASLALFSVFAKPAETRETEVDGLPSQRLRYGDAAVALADARLAGWQGEMCTHELCREWPLVARLTGVEASGVYLPWKGAAFDEGVLHYLGTQGGKRQYRNPHSTGVVVASLSSHQSGKVEDLVSSGVQSHIAHQSNSDLYTTSRAGSWMAVDLGKGNFLCPDNYCLRSSSVDQFKLRHWHLQGSNDGMQWASLRKHSNDTGLANSSHSTASFALEPAVVQGRSFRHFRILQTGPPDGGRLGSSSHHLFCNGIELYGLLETEQQRALQAKRSHHAKELGGVCEFVASHPSNGLCYVRHPSRPLGAFCRAPCRMRTQAQEPTPGMRTGHTHRADRGPAFRRLPEAEPRVVPVLWV